MRIAVYTLTRERLEFTKYTFALLREKAGLPFDHYVIDNTGIENDDGTRAWLTTERAAGRIHKLHLMDLNVGISIGSNHALAQIAREPGPEYDIAIKFDNDCEVVSDNIILKLAEFLARAALRGEAMAISPRVEGIGGQPKRISTAHKYGHPFGETDIIGGLFHVVPWDIYRWCRLPEHLPMARGQDGIFCENLKASGVTIGYVEDLIVRHYMTTGGQERALPVYFERKRREENEAPK